MFTGIIIETGTVESLKKTSGIMRLTIKTPSIYEEAVIGDSVAVNGVCLTVIDTAKDSLSFEVSDETLHTTNLGELRRGTRINLEPALKADGKIGGHFVTGHVDAIGKIASKRKIGQTIELDIEAPTEILQYLIDKGSVAVDGISLTVVKVFDNSFRLVIIPYTEKTTNLDDKNAGSTVNIETDIIGKYIRKFLSDNRNDRMMKKLVDEGFASR